LYAIISSGFFVEPGVAMEAEAPAVRVGATPSGLTTDAQQAVDICCCLPGAQQQTRSSGVRRAIDGTDRQTDGHPTVT